MSDLGSSPKQDNRSEDNDGSIENQSKNDNQVDDLLGDLDSRLGSDDGLNADEDNESLDQITYDKNIDEEYEEEAGRPIKKKTKVSKTRKKVKKDEDAPPDNLDYDLVTCHSFARTSLNSY